MRTRFTMLLAAALLGAAMAAAGPVTADETDTTVVDWNRYAVEAIFNPPTAGVPGAGLAAQIGAVQLAMVQIAVYDALNAIVGGYDPYLDGLPAAPAWASKAAAAATAAHDVLVGRGAIGNAPALPADVVTRLDGYLTTALLAVPDGAAQEAGVDIGAAAADAILAARASDGSNSSFRFTVGTQAGEWRPTSGVNDPFAWAKNLTPLTLRRGDQYLSEGPPALASDQYAVEFNEVKAFGALTGSARSAEQTATALYFTENPFSIYNRSWRALAARQDVALSALETARLLAMANVAGADAAIDCWNNKAHWSNWRPVTAIQLAGTDGNTATSADGSWAPLFVTPPYPDVTSGYNCASGGHLYAARAFFGTDRMTFQLINSAGVTREYDRFSDVLDDTMDARVWLGIHFRSADTQGAWVGKKVGKWVGGRFFQAVD